jgi:transposase-like protein
MEKREFTAEYKTKIVLEVLEGDKMANEIAAREKLNPKVLSNWKQEFLKNAHRAFTTSKEERESTKELKMAQEREQELMAKVGVLTMENDWLKKKSREVLGYEPTGRPGFK